MTSNVIKMLFERHFYKLDFVGHVMFIDFDYLELFINLQPIPLKLKKKNASYSSEFFFLFLYFDLGTFQF